jgi:hypothetical protein
MEAYWRWRPLLIEALDSRYYNPEWLDAQVMSGRAIFLHDYLCAVVAEVRFYPTGARDIVVICAAGDAVQLREAMVPALSDIGRQSGCVAFVVQSRKAWSRILKRSGFEHYQTALRKDL